MGFEERDKVFAFVSLLEGRKSRKRLSGFCGNLVEVYVVGSFMWHCLATWVWRLATQKSK